MIHKIGAEDIVIELSSVLNIKFIGVNKKLVEQKYDAFSHVKVIKRVKRLDVTVTEDARL